MSSGASIKTGSRSGSLYESDSYTWALEQARALREHRAAALDWENLAEEVDDLAARHADSLKSYCQVLIEHLLKLVFAPAQLRSNNRRLRINSARNARIQIKELLEANPGLKGRAAGLFARAWLLGRNDALGRLDLEDDSIPQICPWTFDHALDDSFWPKPDEPSTSSRKGKPRNRGAE
jgi:Domain of unknown function DUF29